MPHCSHDHQTLIYQPDFFFPMPSPLTTLLLLLSTHNLPSQPSANLNRPSCLSTIRTFLQSSPNITLNNPLLFHQPFPTNLNTSSIYLTLPACQQICGSKHEIKDDCAGRVKEWMFPVLLLLVSVEPTAVLTVGIWKALGFYLFVMADPPGVFRGLLGRMRAERRFQSIGQEMWRGVEEKRKLRVGGGKRVNLKTTVLDVCFALWWNLTKWLRIRKPPPEEKKPRVMSKSYGIVLSAMADLLSEPQKARGALRHALEMTTIPNDAQDKAIIKAAESLSFVHTRGAAVAWIAVIVCIVEFSFLIFAPLQQQVSASPSGAKIASAATFTWLLPLVVMSAHLGTRDDLGRSRELIKGLLEALGEKEWQRNSN
ncbi:hypothetical protein QBC38DRAFT_488597 [Podospora fimiseda]|uniref:Uncharacterized protein n=1 Tax=Podospora fimiseda TaxID=252190 RepID=A0AAN7BGT6_9PEZI|nr:hypothetical protein QBC38DRAFT_488597 [Podospora fimiseda]